MEYRSAYKRIFFPNRDNAALWLNACWLLIGIFFLGWGPASVLLAYFLETMVIGLIHIIKIFTVWKWGQKQERIATERGLLQGGGAILFFFVHYFFFVFVQSVFLFSFMERRDADIVNAFDVWHNYLQVLKRPDVQQALMAIVFTNVILAIRHFFLPGKYRELTISQLFFQPYLRIFIQQFTVLLGGFFMLLGGMHAAAVILILLRLTVDLVLLAASRHTPLRERISDKLTEKQQEGDRKKTKEILDTFLNQ